MFRLTATPSKATLGFFDRNLVTEPSGARQTARRGSPKGRRGGADQCPYVQAVADGVNVGYDIYRIKTEVSEKGVTVKAGHDYQKRDRLTRAKRWEIQEAEETFQKTQLYFEQMKGRGTRTIDPDALASVTPDAGGKTRFVLVDAVGVTESDKTDSRPMESKPSVAFDKLLLGIAMGARDEATLTTVASRLARLARLDRMLSQADREEIAKVSGGHSVKQIAAALIKATDPDEIRGRALLPGAPTYSEPTPAELKAAAEALAEEAAKPLASNPALRDLLEAKRRKADVTIDHLTGEELISAGYDEEKALQLVTSWKQFLEDNQDDITVLQILYNLPHRSSTKAGRHLVYEELKTLAEAVARSPYHIAPAEVWKAYEHLEKRPLTTDPFKTLTNLITLVRHTVDPQKTPLAPFCWPVLCRLDEAGMRSARRRQTDVWSGPETFHRGAQSGPDRMKIRQIAPNPLDMALFESIKTTTLCLLTSIKIRIQSPA